MLENPQSSFAMSSSVVKSATFFLCFLMMSLSEEVVSGQDPKKKAFVLGGNGFMGSEVVLRLVEEGYHVTTSNRGNWYWDNPVRVKSKVHRHFACDRDDGILKCWDLRNYISDEVDFFNVVIDFTGYKPNVMDDTSKALKGKVGLYIYVSSDSIYMVSRRNQYADEDETEELDENRPWSEEDGRRPTSASLRERLRDEDPYGDDKLLCEEALVKQRKNGGFPYVLLRLSDVIGARDTTNRWWPYQLWLQFYDKINVPFVFSDKMSNLRTSYVYINDVVEAMSSIMRINSSDIWDRAYNLAFDEPLTLEELLRAAQKVMGIRGVEYKRLGPEIDVEEAKEPILGAIYNFPSVTFGSVDVSRAKTLLNWKPSTLEKALTEITDFYKAAFGRQVLQRDKALKSVIYQVVPAEQRDSFIHFLENETMTAELKEEERNKKQEL